MTRAAPVVRMSLFRALAGRGRAGRVLAGWVVALACGAACAAAIDPASSHIGFSLKTRWGQTLEGHFPRYAGEVATLDDGRHQVRLRLSARDVEILGNPTYTRITRGRGFFEAERYPVVEFVSEPYPPALTRDGGALGGLLTIRGVRHHETFTVAPATCARAAVECDVVASGAIDRNDYGVSRWGLVLSNKVVFHLRVRVRGEGGA